MKARRIILAGHTGLEKGTVAAKIKSYLEDHCHELKNRVGVYDIADGIEREGGGHLKLFAGMSNVCGQRERWIKGWKTLQKDMEQKGDLCSIVDIHLVLGTAQLRRLTCPAPFHILAAWKPDLIVTLIDDVYAVKRRIQAKQFDFSFARLYDWRTTECIFADQIGRASATDFHGSPHGDRNRQSIPYCDSILLAVKHPTATLGRIILNRAAPRVYASFPITSTRGNHDKRTEIDRFRKKLHKLFATFDPLTIEESCLISQRSEPTDGKEAFHPHLDVVGKSKPLGDQRWDCRIARKGDLSPMLWEPETIDVLGKTVPFYPVSFSSSELNEMSFEVGGQVQTVPNEHITTRDYRLVDQADFVVCYRPYWDGRITGGVKAELRHANDASKPVVAFVGSDTAKGKPLEGVFTHEIKNEKDFWSFLKNDMPKTLKPRQRAIYY